jgi:MGT family glycosyltransferase
MSRALFFSLPLHGHTNPSLPVVRALVDRGDEVTYYSAAAFAAKVEATGAGYRPYRNAFLADITDLPERLEELSWLLTQTTAELLAQLDAFRADRPDYIITDSVAPWGHWIGEALGVPVITSVSTFAVNRHVLKYALRHGARPKSARRVLSKLKHIAKAIVLARRLRREHRIKGPGITGLVFGQSDLNVVYTSREFQPCAETFGEQYQFVGPSLPAPAGEPSPSTSDASNVPLVYVSLGTLFNAAPEFYKACFAAFRDEPLRVIMSIGGNVSESALGEPPPNIVVKPHVSQLDVLQRTSVFLTHGGMNSVSESLYHGVPVVVFPQMSEQAMVGARVEELGAGLCLTKDQITPEHLRVTVNHLMADGRFRRQAAVLGQSLRTAGGATRAADVIQAFLKGR